MKKSRIMEIAMTAMGPEKFGDFMDMSFQNRAERRRKETHRAGRHWHQNKARQMLKNARR